MQHHLGLWYVPGGMHKLGEALRKLASEIGVSIYTGLEIVKLHGTEDGIINAAECADGTMVTADYFISNMEVIPTYQYLLEEDLNFIDQLEKKFVQNYYVVKISFFNILKTKKDLLINSHDSLIYS